MESATKSRTRIAQCQHLGQATGELRTCETCRGKVALKAFECRAGHGTVTQADCQTCPDRRFAGETGGALAHAELTAAKPLQWVNQLLRQPPGAWPDGWTGWPNVQQAFRDLFDEASKTVPPPPAFEARGIVICGGGWRFFPSVYVTVRIIRHVGCGLPIQVWYLGDRREFDPRMATALADAGDVGWIDANAMWRDRPGMRIRRANIDHGWMLKHFAAAYCPFAEVISLDADCYPAYNPEAFMAHPEYLRVGACLFPDPPLQAQQYELFGIPAPSIRRGVESGEFIVDKRRHWTPLWLACWLNAFHEYWYAHHGFYGDKDSLTLAWAKAGHDACFPTLRHGWIAPAMIHRDFAGKTLFVHRCQDKFRLFGAMDGVPVSQRFMTRQRSLISQIFEPKLPLEAEAHAFAKECDRRLRPWLHE